jgi:hypothetical protein
MKIDQLRQEQRDDRVRIAATVTWEDCERPTQEVYFETEVRYANGIFCNPHAFLVGCAVPAMYRGEKRILVDGEICPELLDGLDTAMSWLRHWYYENGEGLVRIEAKTQASAPSPRPAERTGIFFSGGIDSLGALRANHLKYPSTHSGAIRDGILVFGQNIESDNRPETFQAALSALREVAEDCSIELIPVYTNIRNLDEDGKLFGQSHGAILGAVGHVFERRLTTVSIASSDDIPSLTLLKQENLKPLGSHPLLEPNYGSSTLRIRHDGLTLSRLDKTRLVSDWDTALQNIRVCGPNWPGRNCGECEKCIRTMLALLALGALDKTRAFPPDDIAPEMLAEINIKKPVFQDSYSYEQNYLELLPLLRERGRDDLVRAVEDVLRRFYASGPSLKARIRRLDRQYLMGTLGKLKKSVFS